MSYELQTDKVLTGGLNLLSPGDMGQPSDALALQNWRVDQGGQLRSRLGMGAAVVTLDAPAHSIGIVDALVKRRYYGERTYLYRDGANISGGFDGSPLGLASFQGRMWVMNRLQQLKDNGTDLWNWTPTAPAAAPTYVAGGAASGALDGDYTYYATGQTDAGEETNPSPALAVTGIASQFVTITRPAFSDPQITSWNVYRSGGAFPTIRYKVNNVSGPILLVNTYTDFGWDAPADNQSDESIADAGVILAVNHDPAPPARFVVGPYLGRLIVFGTAANPNRMFWSQSDQPAFFPGSGTDAGGNWDDVGEEGEEFTGCAIFPQVLVIIKSKSVWRLVGDPGDPNSEIERLNVEAGGIGLKAWAVAGANVYFQGQEGIYKTSVSATDIISPALAPLFKGDTVEGFGSLPAALNPNPTARAAACMAFVNGRLYFSYCSGLSPVPDTTLVMNEKTGAWFSDNRGFSALCYEGQGENLLGAMADTSVYPLEQSFTDDGGTISPVFQSGFRNQGQPTARKHYANLTIEHRLNGATLEAFVIFDGAGSTQASIGTFTSGSDRVTTVLTLPDFEHGEEPRSIAVRLQLVSAGDSYLEVLTIAVQYYIVPLDGVVFDSDNFQLAEGKVCFVQNLELDLENLGSGTVSYEWQSDIPGGQIQTRAGANIKDVVGIGSFRVDPEVKEARWCRLIVRVSSGACRVYGARVQIRPIGLYLTGTDGYATAELSAGSPRLKLLSGIRTLAQADGDVRITLESDTPPAGTGLNPVSLSDVAATTDRQWTNRKLPSTTRAKLLRIRLATPEAARIFSILLRAKALGDARSEWEWFEVPIPQTPDEWAWREITIG